MAQPKRTFPLSEERIYDSSDEDDVNDATDLETLTSKPKYMNGATDHGDNDMEDSSDVGEEKSAEDDDESEDDKAASENGSATTSASSKTSQKSDSSSTPEPATPESHISKAAIPPKSFKAPKDFEPVALPASGNGFDDSPNTLIWIISAPSDVPIDSIKELNVEAVMRGEAVLTHNGIAYGMQPASHGPETSVIDRTSTGKYQQVEKKVERSFIMREISTHVKIPSAADIPVAFTATQVGKPREPRKQPEGLKPRYSPFGAVSLPAAEPDTDVDMADISDHASPKTASRKQSNEKKSAKRKKRD
ncbi:hypothetical protein H2200_004740 [Cladophialophora chaetospira]|uniref:RNA polymerase I, subunit RPA34.5 n=1 Tax=Cladophialophora chaetospira TaxID=386627 RepID=A0AA38XDN2_9EURO|nr:hypothetical protein H2200_004740 [Cladophialophora chaetospira]